MQKTLIGKRAMDRDLVASTPSRGARRRIRREVLAATKKVKPAFVPRPNYRPPVVVKLKRARNAFLPGSVGHQNAVIVGQLRVAREIAARGPRTAVKTGYGDRKRRRKLRSGLADTTTLSKSWRIYYRMFTKEAREEISAETKAETRRKSLNPFKRGFQWISDKARGRGK
jgi:hypothetical protein